VEPHIKRLLGHRGLGEGDDDGSVADAWVVLTGLAAASVQGTVALGPDRGARLRRLGEFPVPGGWHTRANGFNLSAGLVVPAGQRDRLERGVPRCA
jgi:hypothetical protein